MIGTLVVGLIGLVALELFGTEVALIALGISAIYPVLIELSAVLVAETPLTLFELAALYAALRTRRAHDPLNWIVGCGVLTGLATLTHANAILLLAPLLFAVARTKPVLARKAMYAPWVLAVVTALTLAPWLIRDAVELHTFVPITDESGITLAGTYNPTSAHGDPPWRWRFYGNVPADRAIARGAPSMTETELSSRLQSKALDYIGAHPAAPIEVAFDNTLRLLELEGAVAWQASVATIGIQRELGQIGVISFWILALVALAGAFTRAARQAPRWLWAIPVLFWLSVAFVNGETPRFREPIEPFLVMLAACGLASILQAARGERVGSAT